MKIFLIGFMGCGKTHWGQELSKKLSIPFFDLDEKIEEHAGTSITTIFAEKGEEYFRMLEKEVLYFITESHETFVMATGGGTPCFYNNIDYLKKNGIVVWFNCSIDCLYKRLSTEKGKRPLVASIPDNQLKAYIVKKFSNRKIFYQQANVIINEEDIDLEKLVSRIFHE
ncbi:MAG TPA: shikimate kinase [Flavisolibacter sp.]|nr:shikimate kinase [Flavisolibacter sp.]